MFGTDGVRGVFGQELTTELAYQLGRYGSYVLSQGNHHPKIVIGMDTRISGKDLEEALMDGITSVGGDAVSAGVIPTPAIAVITRAINADAGIVISASHNPYQFNGIKFFNSEGYKLPDATEDEIERCIRENKAIAGNAPGTRSVLDDARTIYTDNIRRGFPQDLSGLKLVLDCANGASSAIAPDFFAAMGADVCVIGNHPDGRNINDGCGSTCLDALCTKVVELGADLGLAFDGDADRCLAVDEKGRVIDGDAILHLITLKMKATGTLKQDTVVVTVMSNIGLDRALEKAGCQSVKTKVGDRYVLEEMKAGDYNIGGEQSGHVILLDHNTTGDGMLTALYLATILKEDSRPASQLRDLMTSYPQVLANAHVDNAKKHDYTQDPVIQEAISRVEEHFNGQGRVLIRPSGTEPLVRVMIEGEDQDELDAIAGELAQLIETRLN
jgi:phosphoglucosamine mutase